MKRVTPIGLFVIFFHFFLLFHTQFTAWPEMLSYPYLMDRGYIFYSDIIHPDVPLLPVFLLGVYKTFGFTIQTLQVVTWITIFLLDIGVYFLARKLYGIRIALALLGIFVVFQIAFEGNGLWFDLAVVPFLLSSFYFLLEYSKKNNQKILIEAGILLGVALLIKLSTVWVIVPLLLFIFLKHKFHAFYFCVSIVTTFVLGFIVLDVLVDIGTVSEIAYWGMYYPLVVMARMPGYIQPATFSQLIRIVFVFLPFVVLLSSIGKREYMKTQLLTIFFLGSLFFGIHRFEYFHFQPAIPFFVLLMGYGIHTFHLQKGTKRNFFLATSSISIVMIVLIFSLSLKRNWDKEPRFFDTALQSDASKIKLLIPKGSTAYFHNTPSQYIVASGVLPSKPWADTFAWYLEVPGVQQTIIKAMEEKKVQWVIQSDFNTGDRYDLGVYNPTTIDNYIHSNFDKYNVVTERITIYKRK